MMTVNMSRNANTAAKLFHRGVLYVMLGLLFYMNRAEAASAENEYVTVSCGTAGVESIVSINEDFYITTRGVSAPDFEADVQVEAKSPWELASPSGGSLNLGIGETGTYRVKDESGTEDEWEGSITVVKLDIEPAETNVSSQVSSVTLKLTDDSYPEELVVWTSQPNGISGTGSSISFNPNSIAPGEYVVTATSGLVPGYSDICVVRVVSIEIDDSELSFFRNEDYELPLTVIPPSFSDSLNVSLSGFDNVHWVATYNPTFKKIDFSNLILGSELVGWLDEQELVVSGKIGSVADEFVLTKPLKLKKRFDKLYNKMKESGVKKINDTFSPADNVAGWVKQSMEDVSAMDSEGVVHRIPPGVISDASSFARTMIDDWWVDFVRDYIWSDVPVSSVSSLVVNESWSFDWNVDASVTFSGGTISLDPSFSDVVEWVRLVSRQGFSSNIFWRYFQFSGKGENGLGVASVSFPATR